MASWSENSSYQGAASGAATGGMIGGPQGALIGGAVGFVAGGLIGGSQEDAARKAEEERQKEIQRAIERQNTNDFNAKAQAEQWALADIGINKDDQSQDASLVDRGILQNNVANANAAVSAEIKRMATPKGVASDDTEATWEAKKAKYLEWGGANNTKYVNKVDNAIFNARTARNALAANEGILESYNKSLSEPKKY